MSFSFAAANLFSENCIESANFYSSNFDLKILNLSLNHSELISIDGFRLFISNSKNNCIITPGSITFFTDEKNDLTKEVPELKKEQSFLEKGYVSYLDKYNNRIWIVYRNNINDDDVHLLHEHDRAPILH